MGIVAVVCLTLLAGACVFGVFVGRFRAKCVAIILELRARVQELEKSLGELRRDAVLRQSRVDALAREVEELERIRREEREAALAAESPRRTVMDVLQASGRISAEDVLRARTFMSGGGGAQSEEQALILLGVITEEDVAVASRELE